MPPLSGAARVICVSELTVPTVEAEPSVMLRTTSPATTPSATKVAVASLRTVAEEAAVAAWTT